MGTAQETTIFVYDASEEMVAEYSSAERLTNFKRRLTSFMSINMGIVVALIFFLPVDNVARRDFICSATTLL
jgi:hypothetical protein